MSKHVIVASEIERIVEDAKNKIEILADAYRKNTLIPFCKKRKLTYLAGMGRTVFYDRKNQPMWDEDIPSTIMDVINIETIGRNDVFGYYISDITENDIK